MKLIVGLGNPGPSYVGTRHNVGFQVLDELAAGGRTSFGTRKFEAELAEIQEAEQRVLLAKPQTFMNLSGRSVRQVLDFYKIDVGSVLVVCDDINLPLGQLRFRGEGSAGGHNGLKDLQRHLGTMEYARLRLGVSGPGEQQELRDYVLARFRPTEKAVVDEMILNAATAVRCWIKDGLATAMNRYNVKKNQKD